MNTYIHTYMHTYRHNTHTMHTHIHLYAQVYSSMHAYKYAAIPAHAYSSAICAYMCKIERRCMRVHVPIRQMCVCALTYISVCIFACVCVYIHICRNIYRYMHMKCIYIYICTDYIHTCVYGARVCVCVREYVRICLSALATRTRLHLLLWLQRFDMSVYVDSSSHGNARVS